MKNKIKVSLIFLIFMLMSLCSCEKDKMMKNYPNLKDENHIFVEVNAKEVIELLNANERSIILFSFPECPWCQAAIPYLNEVAKEEGYNKIYYLNILKMRDDKQSEEHQDYLKIYNKIRFDIANPEKINAPTVIVTENGEVLGYHIDTVKTHIKNENNVLEPMTKEQIEELKDIYKNLLNK